ncbi:MULTISPECIES: DUF4381 domain-containing protein [Ochrobactrum]|uniref:DUF4381 domain-containing protein n=1 Tax=Ochrobactrum sp. C6C9 TaxID=2736662 RepID=UPI00352FF6E4|nr:DUF4381 domain-containing protein [Ochrobactrum sp. C6C9]
MDQATETALRTLHDIAIPPSVSWLPQTWGWALVAVLLLLGLAILLFRWVKRYRRNAYRREALQILENISNTAPATEIAELLKRTALSAFPRADVAALSGGQWVAFLESHSPAPLGTNLKAFLKGREYEPDQQANDMPVIVNQARLWIERHHV